MSNSTVLVNVCVLWGAGHRIENIHLNHIESFLRLCVRCGLQDAESNTVNSITTSSSSSTPTASSTVPLPVPLVVSAMTGAAAAEGSPSRSRPDPSLVEMESVAAGVDPADTLTVMSHARCSTKVAIAALRQADGDVVDAAMSLTAV